MYEMSESHHSSSSTSNTDYSYSSSKASYNGETANTEYESTQIVGSNDSGNNLAQNSTIESFSNAGTPLENPNIAANVDDGNDLEKLDFSQQYASPNSTGDDVFSGTSGVNTFDVNLLLNAKPEIYQQHVDSEGKINWESITGENDNYHDHWLDSMGQDTIVDFSGTGGEGDKINISGYTVAIAVLEESDNQVKLGVYSDQGAD
ncbi:MAG: hypothetical protein ACRC80_17065, partial [Waterburya sp.]